MKNKNLFNAMHNLDPQLILKSAPSGQIRKSKSLWMKWASMAACFCLCAIMCFGIWQSGIFESADHGIGDEFVLTEHYVYKVNENRFSAYIGGKVIAEDKIGGKITDVTLTAGWRNATDTEWLSCEKLRGELYSIEGITNDVAVALKFMDKGEAVTTIHYYVIMNSNADLSPIAEYIIPSVDLENNGDIVLE